MKSAADGLALGLGVGLAGERCEEAVARIHMHQRNIEVAAEQRHDLLGLVQPQQAVVDEDAGELVADRLVDQHGGHRAVDAARQPADDAALADLGADLGHLAGAEMRHAPVARQAGDAAHEVADQRAPARRVHHLGVELHGVELARLVGDGRERRALRHADHLEARRQPRDAVAVAHPHRVLGALVPEALEQRGGAGDLQIGAAELAVVPALHAAAELRHHGLLAVADAEHRQAGREHPVGRARRAELGDAGRPAGQDHRLGLEALQRVLGAVERHDLGVDALLAHAPGDQLRHLAAEVDDEDGVGVRLGHGSRNRAAARHAVD